MLNVGGIAMLGHAELPIVLVPSSSFDGLALGYMPFGKFLATVD